jgi:L-fuculose-phosphate aldolase
MLDTMCDVMKTAYERGWITTRDGNVSLRRQNSKFLYITPTGVRKQALTSESILKLQFPEDLDQEKAWDHMQRVDDEYQRRIIGLRPSGELPMHYLLQKYIPTSNRVVVHLHPTHIIAAMYAGYDLQKIASQFPEIYLHTKVGPTVGLVQAQSRELGDQVYDAFSPDSGGKSDFDIVGLHLHGVVAVDRDPWLAYGHIERLNHICEIVLAAGGIREQ